MNYLAHVFFAKQTPSSYLGNLLGDFVKGTPDSRFDIQVIQGIYQHRNVDSFTDTHALILKSKNIISKEKRRFAGIIIDVLYDYFLSKHWDKYHNLSLDNFIQQTYHSLGKYQGYLPEKTNHLIESIIYEDWLNCYRSKPGLNLTFQRIAMRFQKRFNREVPLGNAIEELEKHEAMLEEDFLLFFPELIKNQGVEHAN